MNFDNFNSIFNTLYYGLFDERNAKKPLKSGQDEERGDGQTRCGIGSFKPDCLQIFASIGSFVGIYSCSKFFASTLTVYLNSQVPMLEKQFGFSSSQTGWLLGCMNFGYLFAAVFAGHIAKKVHIPRGLAVSTFIFGTCGIMCAMPIFMVDPASFYTDDVAKVLNTSADTTGLQEQEYHARLCINTEPTIELECNRSVEAETAVAIEKNEEIDVKMKAFYILAFGMILQGVGKSFRGPCATLYVDDAVENHKTGFYMGIIMSSSVFGPAMGFLLGGLFNKMYVTLQPVEISPNDPRWIGAWWLGFIVFGGMALLFSTPLMLFPRRMKKTVPPKLKYESNNNVTTLKLENEKSALKAVLFEVKEYSTTVWRIVRNPVYIVLVLYNVVDVNGQGGMFAFKTKYLTSQFTIPLWQSNVLLSICDISAMSLGTFLGGILTRRFSMTPRTTVRMLLLFGFVYAASVSCGFLVGCKQPPLLGDHGEISTSPLYEQTASPCLEDCACQDATYFPICGDDGNSYYSPCHAGCSSENIDEFFNCTCIPQTGHAASGLCDQGCETYLYLYSAINFLGKIFYGFKTIPIYIAILRSVEARDRAAANSFSGFLTSALGWMPGPVVVGMLVDKSCLLWKYTCGERQSCQLYDLEYFRNVTHAYGIVSCIIALSILIFVSIYFRVKNYNEWMGASKDDIELEITADTKEIEITVDTKN